MDMDWMAAKALIREVMQEEMGAGRLDMASRFEGGTLIIRPADPAMKPREIPVEAFFKKITSVREKLRVLEQKINNNKSLGDADRAEMQTLISRAYGSLTTFNFLFQNDDDRFEGMKSA